MLCFPPKVFIHPIPLIPSQALICVPPWFQALICVPPWFQALKMSRHFFHESPFFRKSPFSWFLERHFKPTLFLTWVLLKPFLLCGVR